VPASHIGACCSSRRPIDMAPPYPYSRDPSIPPGRFFNGLLDDDRGASA
jgi:hypothetical protein